MVIGILIFCSRVWAAELPSMATDPMTAYVYSSRDGTVEANRVGEILGKREGYRVLAVADVRGLDIWPISAIVKKAVEVEAATNGNEVLLDWTGEWGSRMRFRGGGCEVLVVGENGREEFRGICSNYSGE